MPYMVIQGVSNDKPRSLTRIDGQQTIVKPQEPQAMLRKL